MDLEHDIYLGGPPDRRAPVPYKEQIKVAFPDLKIYDWETYKGDDYQEHNDQMLERSKLLVAMVPGFPLPGIGPEIGYFYCFHKKRIEEGKQGLFLGIKLKDKSDTEGANPNPFANMEPDKTAPVNYVILIWPDEVKPDFTKKTIGHYGLIVPTVEEAITAINQSWKAITEHAKHLQEAQRKETEARFSFAKNLEEIRLG